MHEGSCRKERLLIAMISSSVSWPLSPPHSTKNLLYYITFSKDNFTKILSNHHVREWKKVCETQLRSIGIWPLFLRNFIISQGGKHWVCLLCADCRPTAAISSGMSDTNFHVTWYSIISIKAIVLLTVFFGKYEKISISKHLIKH